MSLFIIAFSSLGWAFVDDTEGKTYMMNLYFFIYYIGFMYLQMHVAFPNEDNILITHPVATFKNYMGSR